MFIKDINLPSYQPSMKKIKQKSTYVNIKLVKPDIDNKLLTNHAV